MSGLVTRLRRSSLGVKLAALSGLVTAAVVWVAFWGLNNATRAEHARRVRRAAGAQPAHARGPAGAQRRTDAVHRVAHRAGADLSVFAQDVPGRSEPRRDARSGVRPRNSRRAAPARVERQRPAARRDRRLGPSVRRGRCQGRVAAREARGSARCAPFSTSWTRARRPTRESSRCCAPTPAYFQVAVYPLVQDGFTLGALVLGERLDSAFVAAARAASDASVLLAAGNTVARVERSGAGRARRRRRLSPQARAS